MKLNIQWKGKRKRELQHQVKAFFQNRSSTLCKVQSSHAVLSLQNNSCVSSHDFQTWLHTGNTSGAMKAMDAWDSLQEILTHWSGAHPGPFTSPQVALICSGIAGFILDRRGTIY